MLLYTFELSKMEIKDELQDCQHLYIFLLRLIMIVLCRAGAVVAKYGDKSVYFDLEDLGNTTGQWDLYGSDAPSPYNSLQV